MTFAEGDRVKDLAYPQFVGTIDQLWYDDGEQDHVPAPNGPEANVAEVVWDETGCSSEVRVSNLVKVD